MVEELVVGDSLTSIKKAVCVSKGINSPLPVGKQGSRHPQESKITKSGPAHHPTPPFALDHVTWCQAFPYTPPGTVTPPLPWAVHFNI